MGLYLGESAGARVVSVGSGIADVTPTGTEPVLLACQTHDLFPGGTGGTCIFRGVSLVFRHDAGYAIDVTPIVDGQPQATQHFNGSAPSTGSDGLVTILAPLGVKGTRIACQLAETQAFGSFEVADLAAQYVVLRTAP